jgi:hypothetical protein
MSTTSIESGNGKGYQAAVDSRSRIQAKSSPDCSGATVYTNTFTVSDTSPTTIASARADRLTLILQNQAAAPIRVRFEAANPGATEFQIAAGATFHLPFPYAGQVRAQVEGSGISGSVIVIEATSA